MKLDIILAVDNREINHKLPYNILVRIREKKTYNIYKPLKYIIYSAKTPQLLYTIWAS